jgi:hypothetical protein
MIGCMGPLLLKKIYSSYKDLELDYISFLHTFLSILNISRNDKSFDKKIFQFFFPLIEITSTCILCFCLIRNFIFRD